MPVSHLYVFFGKMSAHFFDWVVCLFDIEFYELFILFFKINLFIFGCFGSLLLHVGFL